MTEMPAIRPATVADAPALGALVTRLLAELHGEAVDPAAIDGATFAAHRLLAEHPGFAAFLAEDSAQRPVAMLTLSECCSLYAGGLFGEIAEFYVDPAWRSHGLGQRMIEAAVEEAKARRWPRLEVGAPDLPRWQRTVDFYKRCGFTEIGPRLRRLTAS